MNSKGKKGRLFSGLQAKRRASNWVTATPSKSAVFAKAIKEFASKTGLPAAIIDLIPQIADKMDEFTQKLDRIEGLLKALNLKGTESNGGSGGSDGGLKKSPNGSDEK